MPVIVLSNVIDEDMLIDFSSFTKKNEQYTSNLQPLANLEASNELIGFITKTENYVPYAYLDVDGNRKIGYNLAIGLTSNGLTEEAAYDIFINQLKIAERKLKKLLPLDTITQSQYDGLLSLFYRTGDFKKVGTELRTFNIYNYVKNRQWDYVATALTNSGNNREIRQYEAKIIMLGDYGPEKGRNFIKAAALKKLEREYPDMIINNDAKTQAEIVYFKETNRFLPGMDQAKKRFITTQLD